jgi:FAD synthetase
LNNDLLFKLWDNLRALYLHMLNRQGRLSLAFNGGKDCTVLLHLAVAALYHRLKTQDIQPIQSVYVTCRNPFPEVDDFVEVCAQRYRLESVRIPAPMRLALQQFIDTVKVKPEAILVGIRRNDPYAGEISQ